MLCALLHAALVFEMYFGAWLCQQWRALLPRCARGGGTVHTLGLSGAPPGDNCNHQEASGKEQKLPGSLWESLATITKTQEDRWCACISGFLGFYGLFGWVHLGMVRRCLTPNNCHSADAVRTRCARGATPPPVMQPARGAAWDVRCASIVGLLHYLGSPIFCTEPVNCSAFPARCEKGDPPAHPLILHRSDTCHPWSGSPQKCSSKANNQSSPVTLLHRIPCARVCQCHLMAGWFGVRFVIVVAFYRCYRTQACMRVRRPKLHTKKQRCSTSYTCHEATQIWTWEDCCIHSSANGTIKCPLGLCVPSKSMCTLKRHVQPSVPWHCWTATG